jgi:hypothetical protein
MGWSVSKSDLKNALNTKAKRNSQPSAHLCAHSAISAVIVNSLNHSALRRSQRAAEVMNSFQFLDFGV